MTDDQKNNIPQEEALPQEEAPQAPPAQEEEAAPATAESLPQEEGEPSQDSAPSQEEEPLPPGDDAGQGASQREEAFAEEDPQSAEEQPIQEAAPQPVENPVPDTQEPEYPRQGAVPPQQPWQQGLYGAAPQGPWGYPYGPYGQQAPGGYCPPMGYQQGGVSPGNAPQNSYPQPGFPAQGYPQGGQPWAGVSYGPPPQPPRKKMSRGLKVFLWIASALAAGAILGFTIFAVSWAVAGPQGGGQSIVEVLPDESQPEESQSPSQQPEEPQIELPNVDVTPNEEGITIYQKPSTAPLDAQEVYDRVVQSTVAITVSRTGEGTDSSGTGIIATADGYIITNAHVVLNTKSVLVTVTTYDGQQYDAVVVGMDRTTDLAILKTNDYGFTPAEFGDAEELSIGEWVLAIGNPGGERFASSLTRGIVSGLDRAVERYSENGMTFIQTDAAINPGNSGGPLVNMYGQVVGINSSKIITDGYEGMGFAIPVSKAKDIIDQLLSGGYVEGRVRLGVTGYDLGDEATFYGLPKGFLIASIDEDSSFAGTEAQPNDIIVAIDGETVEELQDISNLLLRYSPGDQVTVTLYRPAANGIGQGEEIDVTITLLEDKGETQR